ncbi:hypothetical protein CYLTODRAFT_460051 [Cylindrobasidium torrendii FP15055 ss-10]|uniref:Uncharacterized protein n=1 Tax=Cylindrobasidium torrendii FP15055 ss-10 TaxID=1314674 RepID=A0A0D7ASN0_9AGAR|nr:hypothetical protein CYLTODRAFT_460051 [Cylindrobasidium torrendii FP15055 ss-10]
MKHFVFETVMPALMQEFDLDFPSQHLWAVGQKVYKIHTNKQRGFEDEARRQSLSHIRKVEVPMFIAQT